MTGYVIKSISGDGVYYLIKNWNKNKTFWKKKDWLKNGDFYKNEYDYRIGFIDENGSESETEFSVDSNSELEETYEQFCEECGFSKDTVTYIDLVARPRVEMNIGKLKEIIKDLPDDMQVYVACDGFCNYDFDYSRPFEDTDTFGIVHDGKLFITDDCSVDIGNGETL